MNRRQFVGHLGTGAAVLALAGTTLEMSGCNVYQDIENWVPVAENAVNSILAILSANGVPVPAAVAPLVQLIETGLNDLLKAIQEYLATTPPPVGALAKIEALLKAIADQFTSFVNGLTGTGSKILAVVEALATVIISTIAGFLTKLPVATKQVMFKGNAILPVERSRRQFKRDFNGQLDAGKSSGVAVPNYAYLKLSMVEHL